MRYSLIRYGLVAAFATGLVLPQTPSGDSRSGAVNAQPREFARGHWDVDRLTQALNLTEPQKQQAQTIFQHARQSAEPVRQELKQNREKLRAAAKMGNNETEIQRLAAEQGRLLGKLIAIRAEASAKFYQTLTPEQRVKADQMHDQFRQRMRSEKPGTEPQPQ